MAQNARKILLQRSSALGDLVQMTPAVRRLALEGHELHLTTCYPTIYKNNPRVERVYQKPFCGDKAELAHFNKLIEQINPDEIINFDCVGPKFDITSRHTFLKMAGMTVDGTDEQHEMFWASEELEEYESLGLEPGTYAVISVTPRQHLERLIGSFWPAIEEFFRKRGIKTVLCGSGHDRKIKCDVDLLCKTSIRGVGLVASRSLFTCAHDSYILHAAGTCDTPGVFGIFSRPWSQPESHLPAYNPAVGIKVPARTEFKGLDSPKVTRAEEITEAIGQVLDGHESRIIFRSEIE